MSKSSPHSHYKRVADDVVSLRILDSINRSKQVSQRKITNETGIASGLVHIYMKRVINKGWVKAKQVSAKRWLYYLTPEGFVEKSRLTLTYLAFTFENYSSAQRLINQVISACIANNWHNLVIAGANPLSEVAVVNIDSFEQLHLKGVIADGDIDSGLYLGKHKVYSYEQLDDFDYQKVLICDPGFLGWWCDQGRFPNAPELINLEPTV
ncbi:MAG TPA: winged helix-turn-helix transcriptional regulator [Nitrospirae bacterium]|nr:winged helix-turn-helix transcriptional regulator [Nitrospirota bacterium]